MSAINPLSTTGQFPLENQREAHNPQQLPASLDSSKPASNSTSILSHPLVSYLGGISAGLIAQAATNNNVTAAVVTGLTWGCAIALRFSESNRIYNERVTACKAQEFPKEALEDAMETGIIPHLFIDPETGQEIQTAVGILSDERLIVYDQDALRDLAGASNEFKHPLTGQTINNSEIVSLPLVQEQIDTFKEKRLENYALRSIDQPAIDQAPPGKLPQAFIDPLTKAVINKPVGIASDTQFVVYDQSTFEKLFEVDSFFQKHKIPHPLDPDRVIYREDIVNLPKVQQQIETLLPTLKAAADKELADKIRVFSSQKLTDEEFAQAKESGVIPNEFVDPISRDPIEDPVGILNDTVLRPYERSSIESLFYHSKNGSVSNPITRLPFAKEDVISLPEVKKQIKEFIKEHPLQ